MNTDKYRRQLEAELRALETDPGSRTELPVGMPDDGVQDSADQSVQDQAQDIAGQLINMKSDRLQQVLAALQRIEQGTYGVCLKCNRPIAEKRLDAEPVATHCIDCMAAAERGFAAPTM